MARTRRASQEVRRLSRASAQFAMVATTDKPFIWPFSYNAAFQQHCRFSSIVCIIRRPFIIHKQTKWPADSSPPAEETIANSLRWDAVPSLWGLGDSEDSFTIRLHQNTMPRPPRDELSYKSPELVDHLLIGEWVTMSWAAFFLSHKCQFWIVQQAHWLWYRILWKSIEFYGILQYGSNSIDSTVCISCSRYA